MSGNSVAIRLSAEGGDAVVRALQDIGRAAITEFEKAGAASRNAAPGVRAFSQDLDKLDGKLNDNSKRRKFSEGLDEMSYGLYRVGSAVPAAYQPIMTLTDSLDALAYGSGAGAIGVFAAGVAVAAGALLALGAAGTKALDELTRLDELVTRTGTSATGVRGFELTGVRNGLTSEQSDEALKNASDQFEQFKRNSGEVKDQIEKIDEAFLKTLDKTKTFGEWFDQVATKVKALPREEGLDLAKALLGDEAGRKLYDAIMRGETAMQALKAAATEAGTAVDDGATRAARELQQQIDEAYKITRDRLLNSFNELAPTVAEIKINFWESVRALEQWAQPIKEAWEYAKKIADTLNAINNLPGVYQDTKAKYNGYVEGPFDKAGQGTRFGGDNPNTFEGAPSPPERPAGLGSGASGVGASRARYAAREDTGGSSGKEEADRSAEVTHNLEMQLQLAGSIGEAHREIATQIAIERNLKQANVEADSDEGRRIADLTRQIDAATEATKRRAEAEAEVARTSREWSQSLSQGIGQAVLEHKKLLDVLDQILKRYAQKGLDSIISGGMDSLLGVKSSGGGGGLSGIFASLFGGGSGGSNIAAMPAGFSGLYADGGTIPAGMWGITGERGMEVVSGPATVTPMSKLGGSNVTIHNYHGGAEVTSQLTPDGVEIMIDRKLAGAFSAYDSQAMASSRDKLAREW